MANESWERRYIYASPTYALFFGIIVGPRCVWQIRNFISFSAFFFSPLTISTNITVHKCANEPDNMWVEMRIASCLLENKNCEWLWTQPEVMRGSENS